MDSLSDGRELFNFPKCETPATTTSTAAVNKVAVVVQNYKNGESWYRVWSDGWIEQGGNANVNTEITLVKPFTKSNYTVIATRLSSGSNNYTSNTVQRITESKLKFLTDASQDTAPRLFYACGY